MSDFDLINDAERQEFANLAAQAGTAFKPSYDDVVARAKRHRTRARIGGVVLVALLVAGSGVAIHAVSRATPAPPAHSTAKFPRYAQVGPIGMSPMPTYVEVNPTQHAWDVSVPDVPLTGMFTTLIAGDLRHLYLRYQNCQSKNDCTQMLASTSDGGRTWQKVALPPSVGNISAALGATVVAVPELTADVIAKAQANKPFDYYASSDAGATWRNVEPRSASSLPAGWPLLQATIASRGIMAFDPKTGNIDVVAPKSQGSVLGLDVISGLPRAAGMWRTAVRFGTSRKPLPGGGYEQAQVPVLQVSQDGATWQDRTLPGNPGQLSDKGLDGRRMWTTDGKTVVAVLQDGENQELWVSRDGALTWAPGAEITAPGPLMSVLVTSDGAILVEVGNNAFRSIDGGRTIQRVGPELGSRAYVVPGGYAESSNDGRYAVWLSADGGTWRFVSHPPVP